MAPGYTGKILRVNLNKLSHELKTHIDEKIANENLVMMGEFASYIIHDLKNPLSGIHLLSDGMLRKVPDDSPMKKYATEILLASQKLHDFVERTLDIARWSSIKPKLLDLKSIIEAAVNESIIPAIPIHTDYDPGMPKIEGDPQLLQMAFKNLILNAVEAIDGKGEIHVTTEWNGMAIIKISDTGTGIPEDRLKTIFRPFFSMKQQGHGLGLAMVNKAVMLHQGKIEVESKIDCGSTFTIILPETLDKNKN